MKYQLNDEIQFKFELSEEQSGTLCPQGEIDSPLCRELTHSATLDPGPQNPGAKMVTCLQMGKYNS